MAKSEANAGAAAGGADQKGDSNRARSILLGLSCLVLISITLAVLLWILDHALVSTQSLFTCVIVVAVVYSLAVASWACLSSGSFSSRTTTLRIGSWAHIETPTRFAVVAVALAATLCGAFLLKQSSDQANEKPSYLTHDEWAAKLAMDAYRRRDYDKALTFFGRVSKLEGAALVEAMFYQAMCRFHILRHRKYHFLEVPKSEDIGRIESIFSQLLERAPNDRYAQGVHYMRAQLVYQFMGDSEKALSMFEDVLRRYPRGQWSEGATFYSASILIEKGDRNSVQQGMERLRSLMDRNPFGLVRSMKDGVDYTVLAIVPEALSKAQARLQSLPIIAEPAP